MNAEDLQAWLLEHAADISAFTDYEIELNAEESLRQNLERHWFRDPRWNKPGYAFISLGHDGTGGEVALWSRPRETDATPVVFFGSEGGAGVLTTSPRAFAQALAYGPLVQEYEKGNLDAPSRLSLEANWLLSDGDPEQVEVAKNALARYRLATEERLGHLPLFETLVTIPPSVQAEFRNWVTTVQDRASEREARKQRFAAERKREEKRNRASGYAAVGRDRLPPDVSSLMDGHQFAGTCSACGESTDLRLTRFEEFTFGLCFRCYFSNAW
jgi:hypothetical protein